jgi:hypothetical protein
MGEDQDRAQHLLAVTGRRVAAVQSGDLEAVMAALVDEPVFDFFPLGRRMAGADVVRRYYERFLSEIIPRSQGALVGTYVGSDEVAFEFVTTVTGLPGAGTFRLLAVQPVAGDRVVGERLFCPEAYVRLIVAEELWPLLQPIEDGPPG